MFRLITTDENGGPVFCEYGDGDELPAYAILSHTWNLDEKAEVTYEDLINGTGKDKASYGKILFCQRQAVADSLCHFWIDTCCINRQSSAELSEAINSMFRWYRDSSKCYVLLTDVHSSAWEESFAKSRWFTRGWTLQELLAPTEVQFFSADHVRIGDKRSLEASIMVPAGVPVNALHNLPLCQFSVTERMAWAEHRVTKRKEDRVYCLLGLFDVSMSVIYGEGLDRALERLCEEISRHESADESWTDTMYNASITGDILMLRNLLQRIEATLIVRAGVQSTSTSMRRAVTAPVSWPDQMISHFDAPSAGAGTASALERPLGAGHDRDIAQPSVLHWTFRKAMQVLSMLTKPLWYFETLSSWRGDRYVLQDLGPQHVCYSIQLILKTSRTVVASQSLWFANNQKHWINIQLILSISIGAPAWRLIVDQDERRTAHVGFQQMPTDLLSLVTETLADNPRISEASKLHIQCAPTESVDASYELTGITRTPDEDTLSERERLRKFTSSLRHREIPTLSESSMITVYWTAVLFLAFLEDRCFAYYILPPGRNHQALWWNRLDLVIALRGVPYCAALKALVMDPESRLLKGMLVEIPSKGPMFVIMNVHRLRGSPIPWAIRQRWAKQIVKAVAAVHDRGLVLGQLRTYSRLFCIDDDDNAILTPGGTGDHPHVHNAPGLIPPESRANVHEQSWDNVTPESDLFQLGMYLWHLYRDENQAMDLLFCQVADCDKGRRDACALHADPISLPKASPNVPDWLNYVINKCRQADPASRPRARDLLSYFPNEDQIGRDIASLNHDQRKIFGTRNPDDACYGNKRIEVLRETYREIPLCEFCSAGCFEDAYTCNICQNGNFDCCPQCFDEGRHCKDETHLLIKVPQDAHSSTVLRYYSNVKANGQREEIIS